MNDKQIIKKLTEELEQATKPKWISVDEEMPKDESKVICFGSLTTDLGFTFYTDFAYTVDGNSWCFFAGTISNGWSITHWMPLPEPPQ